MGKDYFHDHDGNCTFRTRVKKKHTQIDREMQAGVAHGVQDWGGGGGIFCFACQLSGQAC